MRVSTAFFAAILLGGCASLDTSPPDADVVVGDPAEDVVGDPAEEKLQRVNRELSVDWDNMGRGGAALRQPAYIHVLGEPRFHAASTSIQSGTPDKAGSAMGSGEELREALSTVRDLQKGKGYSLYELSRWERFCNHGKGMDERDWRFVEAEGVESLPPTLHGSCNPPTFTYGDYLTAWTRFCTDNEPNQADRQIVRLTVRPQSVVNPCAALQ